MTDFPKSFHFLNFVAIVVLQPQSCRNILGLGSFPFARHYLGNHSYFLFLQVLRCFSSPRFPPRKGNQYRYWLGCPIRISTDYRLFAPPRGFSQLITSFFVSESQGIPCAPLVTYSFLSRLSLSFYLSILFRFYTISYNMIKSSYTFYNISAFFQA